MGAEVQRLSEHDDISGGRQQQSGNEGGTKKTFGKTKMLEVQIEIAHHDDGRRKNEDRDRLPEGAKEPMIEFRILPLGH